MAANKAIQKKIKDLEKVIIRLEMLHPHDPFTPLRSSLSIPKLLYALRTSACFFCSHMSDGFRHLCLLETVFRALAASTQRFQVRRLEDVIVTFIDPLAEEASS